MAMIMCPECGKMFSNMANACPNCGLPIQAVNTVKGKNIMYCSECGGKLEAGARFCMGCGAKVERREIDYNVSVNKEIKEPIVSNHNNQTQPVRAVVNTNMKFLQMKSPF